MNVKRSIIPNLRWPDGAKVCVTPSIAFETWSRGVVPGANAPAGFLHGGVKVEGARDLRVEKMIEFAGNVGALRLLELLDRERVRAGWLVNGRTVEEYPDVVKAIAASGHDLIGHSFAQDLGMYTFEDPEQERENIRRTTEVIREATGKSPVGWVSPRATASEQTVELLLDEGYVWFGDYSDDELPYLLETDDGRRLVSIPYSGIAGVNDYDMLVHDGFPTDYVEYFARAFDYLYEEHGLTGRVGLVRIAAHAHLYGRPFGRWAVRDAIRYARRFPGAWFATRDEIAACVLEQVADIESAAVSG